MKRRERESRNLIRHLRALKDILDDLFPDEDEYESLVYPSEEEGEGISSALKDIREQLPLIGEPEEEPDDEEEEKLKRYVQKNYWRFNQQYFKLKKSGKKISPEFKRYLSKLKEWHEVVKENEKERKNSNFYVA